VAVVEATNRLDRRLHDTAVRVFHERWAREATAATRVRRRVLRAGRVMRGRLARLRSLPGRAR
jgi:hypothetical protein